MKAHYVKFNVSTVCIMSRYIFVWFPYLYGLCTFRGGVRQLRHGQLELNTFSARNNLTFAGWQHEKTCCVFFILSLSFSKQVISYMTLMSLHFEVSWRSVFLHNSEWSKLYFFVIPSNTIKSQANLLKCRINEIACGWIYCQKCEPLLNDTKT